MKLSMKNCTPSNLIGIVMVMVCLLGVAMQASAADISASAPTLAPVLADDMADPESVLWLATKKKDIGPGYAGYLEQYPEGKYAVLAKARIDALKIEQAVREENAAWIVLQGSSNSKSIQRYLDKYPKGNNFALAKAKLEAILRKEAGLKPGVAFKDCAQCPEMVIVPAGSFIMGKANYAHRVTFSAPFAIGIKEVTQGEWKLIMGNNPSKFKSCGNNCPVDNVSWNDAKEFIRRLNAKSEKEYRLPSEAEWEYSCRAGKPQKYCGSDNADSVAWYGAYSDPKGSSSGGTQQAAAKMANAWGLYDMSGNVAEWTEDGYHEDFTGAPSDGTAWQGNEQGYVLRGGSWEGDIEQASAFYRNVDAPANRDITYGFRIARKFP